MEQPSNKKDFFISYNHKDEDAARWIAWQLEKEGYTTIIQAWDFLPGNNFVEKMDNALKACKSTIAVLSDHYLQSGFTKAEWQAAFAKDPTGEKRSLIPIRIQSCDLEGLLGQIIYIDLVEKRIRDIRGVTGCTKDDLFIVPGNHDVEKYDKISGKNKEILAGILDNKIDINSQVLNNHENYEDFLNRFNNFYIFLDDYGYKKSKRKKTGQGQAGTENSFNVATNVVFYSMNDTQNKTNVVSNTINDT
jgi:hypothetical protein